MNQNTYDEILKLYDEGDFTLFDLKSDFYYQLFYSYRGDEYDTE